MKAASRFLMAYTGLVCALTLLPVLARAQGYDYKKDTNHYVQANLITDPNSGYSATFTDPNLKNPWGMARSAGGLWWIGDNNAGVSTVYDGTGATIRPAVTIPGPHGTGPTTFVSAPTGVVYNGNRNDFIISGSGPAHFIFVTEDGTISAWAPPDAAATLEVDNSTNPTAAEGAVYKGATIAEFHGKRYLYVTNFRSGKVEVYDTSFNRVFLSDDYGEETWEHEESFDDDRIPRGFAPFNIQNVGGSLFVTYAKQNAQKHDDVAGAGLGFVDLYSPSGKLLTRFEHGPWLNAPWGVVWTPRDFGEFSNKILIGNFGSGWIAAYNGFTGQFVDFMRDHTGNILAIDGLWGLTFGNSASAGPYNSLFFTAGVNGEMDGLFGTLTPDPTTKELDEGDEL